jgi:hypothetical protein
MAGALTQDEALKTMGSSGLTPAECEKIVRIGNDNLCANTIASSVGCSADVVEAVLFKPRNGRSSYALFGRDLRDADQTIAKMPAALAQKEIGARWREISESEKERYEKDAKEDKKQQQEVLQQWDALREECIESLRANEAEMEEAESRSSRESAKAAERKRLAENEAVARKHKAKRKAVATGNSVAGVVKQGTTSQNEKREMLAENKRGKKKREIFFRRHWSIISPLLPEKHRPLSSTFARNLMPNTSKRKVEDDDDDVLGEGREVKQPKCIVNGTMHSYQVCRSVQKCAVCVQCVQCVQCACV